MSKLPSTAWRTTPLPDDWERRRISVLSRDRYQCQARRHGNKPCPNKGTEVDHIIPGEDHRLENLQAICRVCHGRKTQAEGQAAKEAKYSRGKEANPFSLY